MSKIQMKKYRLADVVEINKSNLSNQEVAKNNKIKYIDLSSVDRPGPIFRYNEVLSLEASSRARRIVSKDSIGLSSLILSLKSIFINKTDIENLIASTGFFILDAKKGIIDPDYLFQLIQSESFMKSYTSGSQGGTFEAIPSSHIESIEIEIPIDIKEQKRIAEVLVNVDQNISKLGEEISAFEKTSFGIMNELFQKGIGHKKYIQTELGEIPVSWIMKKLEDLVEVSQGLQINQSERFTKKIPNSYVYITNKYIKNYENPEYILNPDKNVICRKDDLLMTRTGNTGIIVTGVEGCFHNNFFKIKIKNTNLIDRLFLFYFFKWERTYKELLNRAGSSTIPDLNHGDFYSLPLAIPSDINEQKRISLIIEQLFSVLSIKNNERNKLIQIKKGLLINLL